MSKKINFNIDQSMKSIVRPSVFDRILKEIDPVEIPSAYIEHILIQYHDGNTVELTGEEINHPIPMNKNYPFEQMNEAFKKMSDIRVFVDTQKLEQDINQIVERYLGKYC